MARIFSILLKLVSGLVLLGVLGIWLTYWLAARSLPDYNADHDVAGIGAEVEIARDNANVPHIFGSSDEDVYFGLGFTHAQDRLFQMMLLRRTAQGRLSEVYGQRTFATDTLMRRLGLYQAAQASVEAQSEETRAALEAYARGVNAWIAEVNEDALGRGAPEFFLFPTEIAYWQPADSLAILKLTAVSLSEQIPDEVLRARASLLLSPERLADLMPDAPGRGTALLDDYAALFPDVPPGAPGTQTDYAMAPFPERGLAGASNVWAAAPGRSTSSATLLANDPHLGFTAPGAWYLARLELENGGVIGASIPGVPGIVSGRREDFGWGITASYLDDADLYVERLNPDNPQEVLTPDGFSAMRSRPSIVQIKNAKPVTLTLQWTDNGPVLPKEAFDVGTITPPGHVMSVAWTALLPDDRSMSALVALNHAHTIEAAMTAAEEFAAPSLNLALADPSRVAMKVIGRAPARDPAHQSRGRIPSPGWIATNRWQGWRPFADLPLFEAGRDGIIGNTNNKTVEAPFPDHLSYNWGDTQRIQRWRRLMQAREVHTRESFIEVQNDVVSPSARTLLPLVGADLWFTGEAAPEGTPERLRQRALTLLAEWNGEMSEHLPEPLIYYAWMHALQDRLIRDDLGPLAHEFTHVDPIFIERVFRDIDGASAWCDVIQSAAVESCTDVARMALDDALVWIGEQYSTDLESLRWGDAHVATHTHPVLGNTPFLKWVVNIRQSTSGGDNTLMRGVTSGEGPNPFANVHGAAYRGVYDFADPDSSVFIIATGQSGHPLSRHYDDLGGLWRRGEYVPMSLDPELARAAGVGVTHLRPR
ncbi:penicillin acylase family protein [Celeribacter indicus]|uniref:Penicillin acylase (Penicillin amidase) n=1 Tax=Celeribacter indicus TaxID=1208324 RepID=A0A0B5DVC3_9RHOB|nr:penicillin acylase family protein [Celeribacter indicus]AJE46969.1 penicillin acylase (penicillin amidase) [Celeribacter indicus]SDW77328.1 penicillin amidase [Celeribacter indicus]